MTINNINKPLTASSSSPLKQGDTTAKRLLGDTLHFCPVALKKQNVLWPCMDEIAAKYREKTFYFSTVEARDSFLQNPAQFAAQTELLKVQVGMRTDRKSDSKKNKNPLTSSLSSPIQASCPADLFAWHPRIRQDHSW